MNLDKSKKRIAKKIKKGFQGYPMITLAYYGPNDMLATKIVVGFIAEENGEVEMEKFITEGDIRQDIVVQSAIIKIIDRSNAKTVAAIDRIIGCPHEEGIDYLESEECPDCEFWHGRNRFAELHTK